MLPSGLPETVADEEDLARFLTSHSHFNAKMVKLAAFLLSQRDQKKKSVCRHGKEPLHELRRLSKEYIPAEVKVYGAGVCKAADIRGLKLDVVASEPPPRHADIVGWPTNEADRDLEAAAAREIAGLIASKCERVMF